MSFRSFDPTPSAGYAKSRVFAKASMQAVSAANAVNPRLSDHAYSDSSGREISWLINSNS
jgi:hypothetical protein